MRNRISGMTLGLAVLAGSACTGVGPLEPGGLELRVTTDTSLLEAIGSQTQLELEFPDGLTTVGLEAAWRSLPHPRRDRPRRHGRGAARP